MRIAAIYDIHGNLPALGAVLREVEEARVDLVVVGGDVVAGPMPGAALALVLDLTEVRFLRGNADREGAALLLGHEEGFSSVEPPKGAFCTCSKAWERMSSCAGTCSSTGGSVESAS